MAATECLLQQEGEFSGVSIIQHEYIGVQVNDFFAISLTCLVLAPILIVVSRNKRRAVLLTPTLEGCVFGLWFSL